MPYGSFGELKPFTPFTSLVSGVGAGEEIQTGALKRDMYRTALQRQQEERAALKTYAVGGGDKDLLAASPDLWMRLNENQRKVVDAGMKEFQEQAPYLTPESYPKWHQDFTSRHKELTPVLPQPDQMKTPEQVQGFVTKGLNMATALHKQKTDIETAAKQKLYQTVQLPAMRLEQQFKEKLTGMQYDKQLTLQENQQKFADKELQKKLDLDREMKEAKTTEAREGHFYTNLRFEQARLNETFMKQMGDIDKTYTGPEKETKELELRRSHDYVNNKILKKYKSWADEYKIPFQEVPEESAAAGTQYMLPSRDDPNKMIPATKEQYNAWHGIK
jgi:hypothetical protein